eukprot:jgi/Chlat1/7981/Chrsp7S07742
MDSDNEEDEFFEAHDTLEEAAAASTSGQSGHLLYARSGSGYSGLRAGTAPALSSGLPLFEVPNLNSTIAAADLGLRPSLSAPKNSLPMPIPIPMAMPMPPTPTSVPATPMHQAPPAQATVVRTRSRSGEWDSLQQQRAAAGAVANAQMAHTRAMSAPTGAGNEPLSSHWDLHLQKVAHARGSSESSSSADSSIAGGRRTGRYYHGRAWTMGAGGGADLAAGDTTVRLGHLELSESESEGGSGLLRVKDLDTGKEYALDKASHSSRVDTAQSRLTQLQPQRITLHLHFLQVFRIKDLDTGKKFIVDEGAGGEELNWVKDLQTGQEFSLKEFEQSLGLSPILQEVERRERLREYGYRSEGEHVLALETRGDSASDSEPHGDSAHKKKRRFTLKGMRKKLANVSAAAKHRSRGTGSLPSTSPKSSFHSPPLDPAPGPGIAPKPIDIGGRVDDIREEEPPSTARPYSPPPQRKPPPPPPEDTAQQPAPSTSAPTPQRAPPHAPKSNSSSIKVSVRKKNFKEFTNLQLMQELKEHTGPVWTMKFSLDGQYLASAGQDFVVRVWSVAYRSPMLGRGRAGHTEAATANQQNSGSPGSSEHLLQFAEEPHRVYFGHKADVLDLCWSKTNFLLSASMDKTVRLWHISINECLRIFTHNDFVTAVDFNPVDDKYFLSGSLDEKIRIWNIPDHHVTDWLDVSEMITAATYAPDGKVAVVGTYKGKCRFYGTEGNKFEYVTQIDVRSTRGKNARGKKITGLQFMPGDNNASQLLVTSNDSRLRIYDRYTLRCKYKGLRNAASQIRASFSAFGDYIISGSEDEHCYIWSTANAYIPSSMNPVHSSYRKDKNSSYECFTAHDNIVTVAIFAPPAMIGSRPKFVTAPDTLGVGSPSTRGRFSLVGKAADEQIRAAEAAGQAAFSHGMGVNQVIITAGYNGDIRTFANVGLPQTL